MKATDIKCPKCGEIASNTAWGFQLVEPATAYRPLAISVNGQGKIVEIQITDVEYDDGNGESRLSHRGCGEFAIPKGFWDFDPYG